MTLDQQIETARKALEELTADEAELTRLEAGQGAEIGALKAAGSRDFAELASLEGKRAALASMLSEQRGHVAQAQGRVSSLEAERAWALSLVALQARVSELTARRLAVDTLLTEMADTLTAHLGQISTERMTWNEELEAARAEAAALFGLAPMGNIGTGGDIAATDARARWAAAFEELGEGADLALTVAPSGRRIGGLSVAYDLPESARRPQSTAEAARVSLLRYFDRPVTLTLAGVLAEADRATPHLLRSQEV